MYILYDMMAGCQVGRDHRCWPPITIINYCKHNTKREKKEKKRPGSRGGGGGNAGVKMNDVARTRNVQNIRRPMNKSSPNVTRQTHHIVSVTTWQWCIHSAPASINSESFHGRARRSIPSDRWQQQQQQQRWKGRGNWHATATVWPLTSFWYWRSHFIGNRTRSKDSVIGL